MVQILQGQHRKPPSFMQSLLGGAGEALPGAVQQYQNQQQMAQKLRQEEAAKRRLQETEYGLKGKNLEQEYALKEQLEQVKQREKFQQKLNFAKQLGLAPDQIPDEMVQEQPAHEKYPGIGKFEERPPQQQRQARQPQSPHSLPHDPAQINRMSLIDAPTASLWQKQNEDFLRHQEHQETRAFEREKLNRREESEITKPIFQELNQARKNIPLQEQAILDIQEAAPNVSARDYFADVTGFEPLRTAEGAKLKTGIKDFFLSDLTRVGARPNQWVEQQLADALPKIGRSAEANLVTAEGMKFKVDLAKKRIEEIDRLAEEDRKKYGYVKADIDSRASKNMKKFVIDRQKELQDNIKKIKSENKGKQDTVRMTSPEGSIYEILTDDIDEAIENGYDFTK